MNKFLLTLGAVISALGSTAVAQEQDKFLPDIPPPTAPFVAKAANPSAWVITIKPKGKGPLAPVTNPGLPPKYLAQQSWIKAGDKMQCTDQWTDGTKTVDWVVGAVEFLQNAQGDGINFSNPASDPFCHDFSQGDFERLDWIALADYAGAVKYLGDVCYVFRSKQLAPKMEPGNRHNLSAVDLHAPVSQTTALINTKTHLPVVIVNADGEFHFQFQTAPAGDLQMPEPYLSFWKAFNRRR